MVVEKLLDRINKSKAVCGTEATRQALASGTVELLLVSDVKIREYEDILDDADKMRCSIMIISSEHDAGQKLLGLGGIAALTF